MNPLIKLIVFTVSSGFAADLLMKMIPMFFWRGGGNTAFEHKPLHTLDEFIKFKKHEHTSTEITDISQLLMDSVNHYVGMSCVEADSYERTKYAVKQQLNSIPEQVRDEILESAIIEGTSVLNVIQNSTKPLTSDGKANSFLAWWHTRVQESTDAEVSDERYETCILIAGISFVTSEIVAGYIEDKRNDLVGYVPCECGYLFCEKCPVFKEIITSVPVFKRHALTLEQHRKLHNYMVQEATSIAENMIQSILIQENTLTTNSIISRNNNNNNNIINWSALDGWNFKIKNYMNNLIYNGELLTENY